MRRIWFRNESKAYNGVCRSAAQIWQSHRGKPLHLIDSLRQEV
jgi:hypothetical protein